MAKIQKSITGAVSALAKQFSPEQFRGEIQRTMTYTERPIVDGMRLSEKGSLCVAYVSCSARALARGRGEGIATRLGMGAFMFNVTVRPDVLLRNGWIVEEHNVPVFRGEQGETEPGYFLRAPGCAGLPLPTFGPELADAATMAKVYQDGAGGSAGAAPARVKAKGMTAKQRKAAQRKAELQAELAALES